MALAMVPAESLASALPYSPAGRLTPRSPPRPRSSGAYCNWAWPAGETGRARRPFPSATSGSTRRTSRSCSPPRCTGRAGTFSRENTTSGFRIPPRASPAGTSNVLNAASSQIGIFVGCRLSVERGELRVPPGECEPAAPCAGPVARWPGSAPCRCARADRSRSGWRPLVQTVDVLGDELRDPPASLETRRGVVRVYHIFGDFSVPPPFPRRFAGGRRARLLLRATRLRITLVSQGFGCSRMQKGARCP